MRVLLKILALAIALALRPAVAGQYETFDYHVQQMIIHALAGDMASVQTFHELLGSLRQPEPGDLQQARPSASRVRRTSGAETSKALYPHSAKPSSPTLPIRISPGLSR